MRHRDVTLRPQFPLAPLAAAIVAISFSNTLSAQQPDEIIEEVIVEGGSYRQSLKQAINIKRENMAFTDSIVATDIADFPDQNLAEALQRIPGVAIERDKGLGTKVNVRSLGVEYTHTTINELSTASGSGGRDVNFDVFASELIQSVTVKKSPVASDEEGGVAGVVAIRTARPFDYEGTKFIATGEGFYNDLSEETDTGASFLASKNHEDKWGVLVSYSQEDRTVRTDQADTAEFKTLGTIREDAYNITYDDAIAAGFDDTAATAAAEAARDAALPEGVSEDAVYAENVRDDIILNEQEKWGATFAFQIRPTDNLELGLDVMSGSFKGEEDDYLFGSWSGDATRAYDLTIDSRNVVTSGSFDNVQHEFKSYERFRDEDYLQTGLTLDWQLGDWDIDGLIGFSGAERTYQRTQAKWTHFDTMIQTYNGYGLIRTSDNFDLATDVSDYSFVFWDFDNTKVDDEKWVYEADARRDLDLEFLPQAESIQFGVRYSEKSMEYDHGWTEVTGETIYQGEGGTQYTSEEWIDSPLPVDQAVPVTDVIPGADYMEDVDGKFNSWMVIPNDWARANYYIDGLEPNYFYNDHYQVDEDVLGIYVMADFSLNIGALPLDINIGGRYVHTDQTSYGYQNVDGAWSESAVSFDASYSDFLPSLNMNLSLNDDMLVRFSAGKVMSRASLSQLSGRREISTNDKTINMGNPDLDPLRATQFDLGYEWYFADESLFSVTGFYKDLKSFITEAKTGTADYQGEEFEVYSYINGEGSTIKGLEMILQFPFALINSHLTGFGINSNYTYVESTDGHISDIGLEIPMFGLAENTYNLTLYYENYGFDARISYNYVDEYVDRLEDNLYPIYREGYGQYDLSAGYQFTDQFKLFAQVINLTDEDIAEYQVDPDYPSMYQVSGRRISLGLRYEF